MSAGRLHHSVATMSCNERLVDFEYPRMKSQGIPALLGVRRSLRFATLKPGPHVTALRSLMTVQ